jgi:hypothetical protein
VIDLLVQVLAADTGQPESKVLQWFTDGVEFSAQIQTATDASASGVECSNMRSLEVERTSCGIPQHDVAQNG